MKTDLLILGTGIAGLSIAVKAALTIQVARSVANGAAHDHGGDGEQRDLEERETPSREIHHFWLQTLCLRFCGRRNTQLFPWDNLQIHIYPLWDRVYN